ncbi:MULTISPECIES: hypothetical protein [Sphingobium]|uniref:hypothetical protein n=1 Tax=Sphingobium sp. MI1205 TaxID=407020 RepID=UPI000770594C|nr:hypothetical protein [Sphingobium sp. MI1205]AMK19502.1 hypothetical protein K663_15620 [Sphingobium sp. MI1205]
MSEPVSMMILALSGLLALTIVALAALRGWSGWLELKRAELGRAGGETPPSANARIEVADLKERIRKLEAIAAGVDI